MFFMIASVHENFSWNAIKFAAARNKRIAVLDLRGKHDAQTRPVWWQDRAVFHDKRSVENLPMQRSIVRRNLGNDRIATSKGGVNVLHQRPAGTPTVGRQFPAAAFQQSGNFHE